MQVWGFVTIDIVVVLNTMGVVSFIYVVYRVGRIEKFSAVTTGGLTIHNIHRRLEYFRTDRLLESPEPLVL